MLWATWAVRRLPNRVYLLLALGAVMAGSVLLATASGWWQVLAGAAVAGGIGAACAVLTLSMVTPFAPYGYAVAGLALAPVWPTGLAWLAETHPDGPAINYLLVASMLGGALLPYATGWIITAAGTRATPAVLAVFAAACLTTFTAIARAERPATDGYL